MFVDSNLSIETSERCSINSVELLKASQRIKQTACKLAGEIEEPTLSHLLCLAQQVATIAKKI